MPPCPRVLQWLKDFAKERKLAWQQDSVGNIVIKRPGSAGGEHAPTVVIQARPSFFSCMLSCMQTPLVHS